MAISNKPSSVAFLVYVDESDIGGIQTFEQIKRVFEVNGLMGFVSPVHHESEKYHIHILMLRPSRCGFTMSTWKDIAYLLGAANNHVEYIACPHKYARYLLHLDNPEKEQFDIESIHTFGDLVYKDYIKIQDAFDKIKSDDTEIIKDIILYIQTYYITSYKELVDFCLDRSPNWLPTVVSKHNFLLAYMRSMEYEHTSFQRDYVAEKTSSC